MYGSYILFGVALIVLLIMLAFIVKYVLLIRKRNDKEIE